MAPGQNNGRVVYGYSPQRVKKRNADRDVHSISNINLKFDSKNRLKSTYAKHHNDMEKRKNKSLERYQGVLVDGEMATAGISSNLRIENPKDLEIENGLRLKGIPKKANYYDQKAETVPSPRAVRNSPVKSKRPTELESYKMS